MSTSATRAAGQAGPGAGPGEPGVTSITPTTGRASGGTSVVITGHGLVNPDGTNSVAFGTAAAASKGCTVDGLTCTVTSPPGTDGTTVDVQATTLISTSPAVAADKFTYVSPVGALYSSGITSPKGGVTWIPDTTPSAGHYWVPDHGNGLCRMDSMPGRTTFAHNVAECAHGCTNVAPSYTA